MGKKTNWTVAEDQALCRAWLGANKVPLQVAKNKSASFWNEVLQLFQREELRVVERPLNGLKVRWTRINRESQKFALVLKDVQAQGLAESGERPGDSASGATLNEEQWVDDAKEQFFRTHGNKFLFEGCWKMLRNAPMWLQMLESTSRWAPVLTAEPTSRALTGAVTGLDNDLATTTPLESAASSGPAVITTAHSGVNFTIGRSSVASNGQAHEHAPPAAALHSAPAVAIASSSVSAAVSTAASVIAAAVSLTPVVASAATVSPTPAVPEVSPTSEANTFVSTSSRHKRRAAHEAVDSTSYAPLHEFHGLNALVDEVKRHNDLLEDQNAIALLRVDADMIPDSESRLAFQLLRSRYLKRVRTNASENSSRPHNSETDRLM